MIDENKQFEDEVRRIARALWPAAEFHGSTVFEGREADGIFETEDCIHVVEATTSRRKDKAIYDTKKISKTLNELRRNASIKAVRGWFITRQEPTAEQRKATEQFRRDINVLSFSQFQSRLIDSKAYLSARDNYKFGSVRDPVSGDFAPDIEYVPLDVVKVDSTEFHSVSDIVSFMNEGKTVVLLGDYGAGKSMTLREVYRKLQNKHYRSATSFFPVYLNLRDHYGQVEPAEIIMRHARSIGFAQPSHLVRAWRAGYIYLLIDGFDEIFNLAVQGMWRDLRRNRYNSMESIRRLIKEHPRGSGIMIAGRAHFFDNPVERRRSLGLTTNFIELSLNDFTEEQITTYLERSGVSGSVPSWLPSRPLLVGYLAARGLLGDAVDDADLEKEQANPAVGWDILLDRISDREAEIEAGIDGNTVRRILERLATKTRSAIANRGSLSADSVIQAFNDICGYTPDGRGMLLLQRLPGLGVDQLEENSRIFVDESFSDALKSGDLIEFIDNPFGFPQVVSTDIENSIGVLGFDIARYKIGRRRFTAGKVNAALVRARDIGANYMAADVARVMVDCGYNVEEEIILSDVLIPFLELRGGVGNQSNLKFKDCLFSVLDIAPDTNDTLMPSFVGCYIENLEGRISRDDLSSKKFVHCDIDEFVETADTTSSVLDLDLPLGVRVCLTILKKLYQQAGAGRRENALHRGLDSRARRLVSRVLRVLQSEGLAFIDRSGSNNIWRPIADMRPRVRRVISSPSRSDDQVLIRCKNLES